MDALFPGDIICYYTKWSLISWLIRKIQHCRWSHVGWVYNETFILEALSGGVKFTLLDKLDLKDKDKYLVVRVKKEYITQEQMKDAVILAGATLTGSGYDWLQIFKLAWVWAWKMRHTSPADGNKHKIICSEEIAKMLYYRHKFQFRDDVVWQNTVPKDIAESRKVDKLVME